MKKKAVELTVLEKVKELKQEKQWREIIDLVDKNIENSASENESANEYKFLDVFDYLYYCNCYADKSEGLPNWNNSDDIKLLYEKAVALKQLKRYEEANELIDYMLEIAPTTAKLYLMKSEMILEQEDVIAIRNILTQAHQYIWKSSDFAVMLSQLACVSMITEDYNAAVAYASLAVCHNDNELVKKFANNILNKAKMLSNDDLNLLSKNDAVSFFESKELIFPTDANEHFAYDAYSYVLTNFDDFTDDDRKYIRKNLIKLSKGYELSAKIVEVKINTGNTMYVNTDHKFAFQASKEYKDLNSMATQGRLYEFNNGEFKIVIDFASNINGEDEYYSTLDNLLNEHVASGLILVQKERLHISNELLTEKVVFQLTNGKYCIMYWIKLSNNSMGRIYTVDSVIQSEAEREIINILSNWEYID